MEEQENINSKRNMSDNLEPVLVSVEKTDQSSYIYLDKDEFKIGRGRANDEIIAHVSISRQHCVFKRTGDNKWSLHNISGSGTILNGVVLENGDTRDVKIGDMIQLGPLSEFLYKFDIRPRNEPFAKRARFSDGDNMDMNDIVMKQKTFEESQQMERNHLAEQMKAKHTEQLELKNELAKLLYDRETAMGEKDDLNRQINTLEKNIEDVKVAEMNLEKLNKDLSERLDKERQEFETKLNEEKQKMEEALEMSRKEKEILENKLEKLRNEQQIECKKLTESLSEEKKTAEKLQSEKIEFAQKLKDMEDALVKIEAKANELQDTLEKQNASKAPQIVALGTVAENVEIVDASNLTILDTIDLTDDNTPAVKKTVDPNGVDSTDKDVYDKVGDIMDEQLTCSICSELFVTALTLNCTHTFCQYCINTWMKKKKECPVCRTGITAMNRSLVLDNFIDKMIENLPLEYKNRRTEIVDERRANERLANEAANQGGGKKGRGRPRGGNANANPAANAVPNRVGNASAARSVGSTSNYQQTTAPAAGLDNSDHPTNDDDDDASTWSTSTDADGDTASIPSSYSVSQNSENPEGHFSDLDNIDNISIDSDGHSTDNSWGEVGFEMDDEYWSGQEDDYVEGVPGAAYGGYGSCYICGKRGHWSPGCPFR